MEEIQCKYLDPKMWGDEYVICERIYMRYRPAFCRYVELKMTDKNGDDLMLNLYASWDYKWFRPKTRENRIDIKYKVTYDIKNPSPVRYKVLEVMFKEKMTPEETAAHDKLFLTLWDAWNKKQAANLNTAKRNAIGLIC